MDIPASGFLHHAPLPVNFAFLAVLIYPFASLRFLPSRPKAPIIAFLAPLLLSVVMMLYVLYTSYRSAATIDGVSFGRMAWGITEAVMCVTFGAGSSFLTALFNIRLRRRDLYVVMATTGLLVIVTWAVASRLLHVVRFGGTFWGGS